MSFFYTTSAGAVDFGVLIAACGLVLILGPARARVMALALLGVFIADRMLIAWAADQWQLVAGSVVELAAVWAMLAFVGGVLGRAMASLHVIKMAFYVACLGGLIDFSGMAAAAAIAFYAQILVLMLGVPRDGSFRRLGLHRGARSPADRSPSPVQVRVSSK